MASRRNIQRMLAGLVAAGLAIGLGRPVAAQTGVPSGVPTPAPGTSVNVGVADTALVLTGCASPNAFVQIFRDNTQIGTVIANNQGRFAKRLTIDNSAAGLHNFQLYYYDANSRTSSVVKHNLHLSAQKDTALDILLPTTIEHEPEPVVAGNYLIFRGSTCPGSLVNVNIDNNLTLAAKADSKGNWYVIANTDNYYKGGHTYDAVSSLAGQISPKTQKYQFTVTGAGPAPGEPPRQLTPPVITEPADLFLSASNQVTVRGTGPLNAQIELFVDGRLSGSVFTNAFGQWSFVVPLDQSLTAITARSCYERKCGDFGNTVRVRFGGDITGCDARFRLDDYRFFGLRQNDGLDLNLTKLSDQASLNMLVDWGDGTIEHSTTQQMAGKIHHVYSGYGQYNGSVSLSDDSGCLATAYFSVLVSPGNPPNWWLLAIIPIGGGLVYLVSHFVGAYRVPKSWAHPLPTPQTEERKPAGWPASRPWLKPAYGEEPQPKKPDLKKKS